MTILVLAWSWPYQHATKPTPHRHTHHHHRRHHDPRKHVMVDPWQPGAFDLCVANRENGEPGSTEYDTIDWHAENEYDGAYSFMPSTWDAAGGQRFAARAYEATPDQQTLIFRHWFSVDPGAWPNTAPPCEYLLGT